MVEELEVGRRGLEYLAAGAEQGSGRPALRRGVGEQTCLFSNFTQGAKISFVDLYWSRQNNGFAAQKAKLSYN